MRRLPLLAIAALLAAGGSGARAAEGVSVLAISATGTVPGATGFEGALPGGAPVAVLLQDATALIVPPVTLEARSSDVEHGSVTPVFTSDRARVLLRSLTIPGWGQATAGRKRSAAVFAVAEASIWGSFTAFRIQETMRRHSYELTARLLAGIDVRGRDEEFRRIVGFYLSSDDYNLFVVYRDAANLYYDDPARYRAYIAEHELKGGDTWKWDSVEALLRYRNQRKDTQRASQRANAALALAVVDRLVSALHAARFAGQPAAHEGSHSLRLDAWPADPADPTAYRLGVRARF